MPNPATTQNKLGRGIPRALFRWIHLVLAIPIAGYIYSPFDKLPDYAPLTRYLFLPLMVVTGLWMWKGQAVLTYCKKMGSTYAKRDSFEKAA
jgi:hypothetical protein